MELYEIEKIIMRKKNYTRGDTKRGSTMYVEYSAGKGEEWAGVVFCSSTE